MGRTYLEMNEDKAYLLYLLSQGKIVGNVKIVKLIFLINYESLPEEKIFHYNFVKWHNGPYSKWIQNDLETLINGNFVKKGENNSYTLTEKGNIVLNEVLESLKDKNKDIITKIYKKYNDFDLRSLLDHVYNLDLVNGKKFGESIEMNMVI